METKKDMIFLKGKESAVTNILFLIAIAVFIVPIVAVFTLRFLYKLVLQVKESASVSTQVETNLNKVY
ncbi:MAG: hypothetical protein DRI95_05245 [Bacteroidetes bacterium]|nr:MAG: hypothetical protein DRI95_05245 [Bacteroidota bacterium]RLD84797.1 MAG: hypothetical protein DRJ07_04475 [Bacteroidota bacterium]